MTQMKKIQSAVLIFILIFQGCAANRSAIRSSSLESEVGNAIHRQILQTIPVYPEEKLNEYIQSVGYRIVKQAERTDLKYRFVILNDDRIYSTFAPGGYVYVTTGFFRFLQNEIELAGVLAFEIAALQYKDPRLSAFKKSMDFLVQGGSYVAPAFGPIGVLSLLGLVAIGAVASNEKDLFERIKEADQRTLAYLVNSGYDPQGFIHVLNRVADVRSSERAYLYDYLQSHPVDMFRIKDIDSAFQKLSLENQSFHAGREIYLAKTELIRSSFAKK